VFSFEPNIADLPAAMGPAATFAAKAIFLPHLIGASPSLCGAMPDSSA
jgi:hypothetical protein